MRFTCERAGIRPLLAQDPRPPFFTPGADRVRQSPTLQQEAMKRAQRSPQHAPQREMISRGATMVARSSVWAFLLLLLSASTGWAGYVRPAGPGGRGGTGFSKKEVTHMEKMGNKIFEGADQTPSGTDTGKRNPSSGSLGLTHYSQVAMFGLRYKSVNFGAEKSPGFTKLVSPNRLRQS
jgi:hypothetical protein